MLTSLNDCLAHTDNPIKKRKNAISSSGQAKHAWWHSSRKAFPSSRQLDPQGKPGGILSVAIPPHLACKNPKASLTAFLLELSPLSSLIGPVRQAWRLSIWNLSPSYLTWWTRLASLASFQQNPLTKNIEDHHVILLKIASLTSSDECLDDQQNNTPSSPIPLVVMEEYRWSSR